MRLFDGFFEGKEVLVTGHTGFKGAWLALWLMELGARVTGYSLPPPTRPSLFEKCQLSSRMKSCFGDIRDGAHLADVIGQAQPEIIFHLAAQPIVRASYLDPLETFSTNLMGTVNLLEAVRSAGKSVRVCQVITSDKCYKNQESMQPHVETDAMGGHDPYSASKGAAELIVASYRNSFFLSPSVANSALEAVGFKDRKVPSSGRTEGNYGLSLSSVRAGNVIGGGDWREDRIVPDCVRALSRGKAIVLRNPQAIRPWQYVLDALSGYLSLAQRQVTGAQSFADAWNFGPTAVEDLSVADLAMKVIQCWGSGTWTSENAAKKPKDNFHERAVLRLDCSKAQQLLNWQPVLNLEEMIEHTVRWYREADGASGSEAYDLSLKEIQDYEQFACERGRSWAISEKVRQ